MLAGTVTFLAFYVLLVLVTGLYSRLLARRVAANNLYASLRRFNRLVQMARYMICAWFAWGLWELDWGWAVRDLLGPLGQERWQFPLVFVGTLPAILAWMGLWWAQYPADVALREQNLLFALDADLPVHAPPSFFSYFGSNVRLQILFIAVPVMLILLLRDLGALTLHLVGFDHPLNPWIEGVLALGPTAVVFTLAPELLRRVLHTQPLPDGPLRHRLESLYHKTGLAYRDILLWNTHHNVGNAAVMGILPQVRFILMTDLLVETMTDEQIEAVFAHEAGHIVHRHIAWYVVFFVIMLAVGTLLPDAWIDRTLAPLHLSRTLLEGVVALAGFGIFWGAFGVLSRRFERQADVYAARTLEANRPDAPLLRPADAPLTPADSYVGPYGTTVFNSALQRVAAVNNIPIAARNWTHGSIDSRMRYLRQIAPDPTLTLRFDRFMRRLYLALFALLLLSVAGLTWALLP